MEQCVEVLCDITGYKSRNTVYENILIPYKSELDYDQGGPIVYPETRGQRYLIDRAGFERWWRKNIRRVREGK